MMKLFVDANFNFISNRKIGYLVSFVMITVSLGAIFVRGLQYGIDFRGGTELVVSFQQPVSVTEVRALLNEAGIAEPQVRHYGSSSELQVRTVDSDIDQLTSRTRQALETGMPENPASIVKTNLIGPAFADDMRDASRTATVLSLLVISLYILVRFQNLSFTVAVLFTLIHDVIIILGIFTLLNGMLPFNMDIDQVLIGAFLTIIGYSLNDTIVVFDRIRENKKLRPNGGWPDIVNKSINQTLSRTVVTSLTTFLVVAVLFVFGGAVLKGFSFAMMTGIVLGTYSTIFISCPLLVDMKKSVKAENYTPDLARQ